MRPVFKVLANGADITAAIAKRLVSLRLSDESGLTSDTLEIVLADDTSKPVALPSRGAELRAYLGYDSDLQDMGLFVADELTLAGWPATLTIRARAAIFDQTPGGKSSLGSQRTRSWRTGTTFGALAATIAGDHGLTLSMSPALRAIPLQHQDQRYESDINLLSRLARTYDAIAKPAGGSLVIIRRGDSTTATGTALPRIEIRGPEVTAYSLEESSRDGPGTVETHWWHKGQARRQVVRVGQGEPVKSIKHSFQTEVQALAAANAELARRERAQRRLSITIPGRTAASADARLVLSELRPGIDGEWLITSVSHSLTPSGGYVCELQCETPAA